MPADSALYAGSLGDEVVAMVDQQPHLARGPVERAVGRSGSRHAARATASASMASDLPGWRALDGRRPSSASARERRARRRAGDRLPACASDAGSPPAPSAGSASGSPTPARPDGLRRSPRASWSRALVRARRPPPACACACARRRRSRPALAFHPTSPRHYDRLVAVAVGRTCLSRETGHAPMKSRPAALRHPAGSTTGERPRP